MTHPPKSTIEQTININAASRLKSDTRQANWRRANPKKYAAHIAVQRALNQGKIVKQPCEICGEPKVDAHHDDYSQPLKVRWLCRSHHSRLLAGGDDMFKVTKPKGASS